MNLICVFNIKMSKCRGNSDLGLCMTLAHAKRMWPHSADFRFENVFGRRIRLKAALRSGWRCGTIILTYQNEHQNCITAVTRFKGKSPKRWTKMGICDGSFPLRTRIRKGTHWLVGWGPHQRGWSDDACATTQPQPRHELAWILKDSWADFNFQDCSQWFPWLRSGCTIA